MKKIYVLVLVLVLAGAVGVAILMQQKPKAAEVEEKNANVILNTDDADDTDVPESGKPADETFTVVGGNFKYDVQEIKVKKGETVKIVFKNEEGFHDFRIDEFNAATSKIKAGAEETIVFTADKAGTFEYYCSVGTHRQMGMKGNLIVE